MSKELEALDEFLKDYLFLCEKLHTNMQEKMLLDGNSPYNVLKTYLEALDNSNPSEALRIVDKMANYILLDEEYGFIDDEEKQSIIKDRDTIKQALLKAQEPKQYLKWEDLEKDRIYKVVLNGNQYELVKRYDDYEYHCDYIILQKEPTVSVFIYEWNKEIFNDLHLERVEE